MAFLFFFFVDVFRDRGLFVCLVGGRRMFTVFVSGIYMFAGYYVGKLFICLRVN